MHKRIAVAHYLHCTILFYGRIRTSIADAGETARSAKTFTEETIMNPIRIAKNWMSYRRTMAELGNLSSQTLNDIGVTRYEIRNIAARSFR
jgi:uncharacterized protein YjiS (DUF1127 family)